MKPVHFKEANRILIPPPDMEETCKNLPTFQDGNLSISCWRPSFWERLKILFIGKIWLGVHFENTQPPVWLDCSKTIFLK